MLERSCYCLRAETPEETFLISAILVPRNKYPKTGGIFCMGAQTRTDIFHPGVYFYNSYFRVLLTGDE